MKIVYQGLFIKDNLKSNLSKAIKYQHVTMVPPGRDMIIPDELLGKSFQLLVDGYAMDGKNEGFRVQLPKKLQTYYVNEAIPHITSSIANDAKPVNTGKLVFDDLTSPFYIEARIGNFVNGKPIFEKIS